MGYFSKGAWVMEPWEKPTMLINNVPILFNIQRLESRIKLLEEQVEQLKCKKS